LFFRALSFSESFGYWYLTVFLRLTQLFNAASLNPGRPLLTVRSHLRTSTPGTVRRTRWLGCFE